MLDAIEYLNTKPKYDSGAVIDYRDNEIVATVWCPLCARTREIARWQVRDGSWIICPCHKRK